MINPEFNSDTFAVQSWIDIFQLKDVLIQVPVFNPDEANENIIRAI